MGSERLRLPSAFKLDGIGVDAGDHHFVRDLVIFTKVRFFALVGRSIMVDYELVLIVRNVYHLGPLRPDPLLPLRGRSVHQLNIVVVRRGLLH